MTGFPLHLLGILIVGLWMRARPRLGLRALLALWWVGIILLRIVPNIAGRLLFGIQTSATSRAEAAIPEAIAWLGGVALLRALLGFTLWARPVNRRQRVWRGLLLVSLLLGSISRDAAAPAAILAIPWLLSFRWRADLGAGGLLVATFTGFASMLLSLLSYGWVPGWNVTALRGFLTFAWVVNALGLLYSVASMPATASRIHLSIRRIGPRLIGSHLLAGLVPLVLSALFLLLSGALFLSTYRGAIGQRYLTTMTSDLRGKLARGLGQGPEAFAGGPEGRVLLLKEGGGLARRFGASTTLDPDSILAADVPSERVPLLWDGGRLYIRARIDTITAGRSMRAEALLPVDSLQMALVSRIAGVPIRVNPRLEVQQRKGGIQIGGEEDRGVVAESVSGGAIGPRKPPRDLPGGSTIYCLKKTSHGWERGTILISSSAPFGEQIVALFSTAKENPLSAVVLLVLGFLSLLFLMAIWITVAMVLGMGRTITRSVGALTDATAAVGTGNLRYRIPIEGEDEIWRVAVSFNGMAERLEKMREVERESQRLEEELRLARVIQDRLLPSAPPEVDHVELAGLSLPAREIGGDYFDYIVLDRGLIGIAVADVSGKGAPAALLMSSFRASLRSQDLATLGPGEVLGRLNRFIHSSVDPGKFITSFLCLLDPATGELRYANAGHDPPQLIQKDGTVSELLGGGLILGLLPQIVYEEARTVLPPASLLAIFTDGVTEAQSPAGDFFGSEGLLRVIQRNPGAPCVEVLRNVVEEIQAFAAPNAQFDDITLVLARRR